MKNKIFQILNIKAPLVHEPNIQTRKRCKAKSKKGKGSSSTRRDPSQFEMVEAAWQSRTSHSVGDTSINKLDLNIPLSPTQSI